MDGDSFFRRQARECREAAAAAAPAESRALMQLAKHYEKEARTASATPAPRAPQPAELNGH
jgi:hypothetical protein